MKFDVTLVPQALEIMALGMAGIFIVMIILYLASLLLIKVLPEEK